MSPKLVGIAALAKSIHPSGATLYAIVMRQAYMQMEYLVVYLEKYEVELLKR